MHWWYLTGSVCNRAFSTAVNSTFSLPASVLLSSGTIVRSFTASLSISAMSPCHLTLLVSFVSLRFGVCSGGEDAFNQLASVHSRFFQSNGPAGWKLPNTRQVQEWLQGAGLDVSIEQARRVLFQLDPCDREQGASLSVQYSLLTTHSLQHSLTAALTHCTNHSLTTPLTHSLTAVTHLTHCSHSLTAALSALIVYFHCLFSLSRSTLIESPCNRI